MPPPRQDSFSDDQRAKPMIEELSPREFLERRAAGTDMILLDVREDWETQLSAVPSSTLHIPMGKIPERLQELDPRKPTVVMCRSGGRSLQVAQFLTAQGFDAVSNLTGGILAWSKDVDPSIPQY
jgi:rhodanese-related sulfurtransferase